MTALPKPAALPSTQALLAMGGDKRIEPSAGTGLNRYGCSLTPNAALISYSSSTASTISPESFAASERLRHRLLVECARQSPHLVYSREMERIRGELIGLYRLEALPPDIAFAPSGTDMHLLACQLISGGAPLLVIVVEAGETGRGVHAAIGGRHFSENSAFASLQLKDTPIAGAHKVAINAVACRHNDGAPRTAGDIDGEVEALAERAVAAEQQVLLIVEDVSKSGLLLPSPACALKLKKRFAGNLEVLVDACQLRLAPSTMQAYLQENFLIAVTGSKFAAGPPFSAALLVPKATAARFKDRALPQALSAYSAQGDWPASWKAHRQLAPQDNIGLLLRWEAALVHMRAFHGLAEQDVSHFLAEFADAVTRRLASDAAFEPLPTPELNREPIVTAKSWDSIPTIFPFLLRRSKAHYYNHDETASVYRRLQERQRCVGQPVTCGTRDGAPLSALRLCLDMRLIADALSPAGRGRKAILAEALGLLDTVAAVAREF